MNVFGINFRNRSLFDYEPQPVVKTTRQVVRSIEKDGMFVPVVESVPVTDSDDIRNFTSWRDYQIDCLIANDSLDSLRQCPLLSPDPIETMDKIGDVIDSVDSLKQSMEMNVQSSNPNNNV